MSTSFGDFFNIFKEMDLTAIQAESEQPLSLLIAGESTIASALATNFSQTEGKMGIHPWVIVEGLPFRRDMGDLSTYHLALLVSKEVELNDELGHLLTQLHRMKIPTLIVIVNETGDSWIGARLVRRHETGRIVLPSVEPDIIQEELVELIVDTIPNKQLSLARHFPLLRATIIRKLIEDTSRANAIYAVSTGLAEIIPVLDIPLNMADIVILTKNQLIMAYKIALANGKEGKPYKLLGEVVSVIGGGFLLREIARKLVGLIPIIGIIPKVVVSYAGTRAIGEIVYLWASGGQQLEKWEVDSIYDEAMKQGRLIAEGLTQMIGFGGESEPVLPSPDRKWWWQREKAEKQIINIEQVPSLPAPSQEVEIEQKQESETEDENDKRWWHRFRRTNRSDVPQ